MILTILPGAPPKGSTQRVIRRVGLFALFEESHRKPFEAQDGLWGTVTNPTMNDGPPESI